MLSTISSGGELSFGSSPFHHLHPVLYLLYQSQHEGQLVIEDPVDQWHCQWDTDSDEEPYVNDSTYLLYSVLINLLVEFSQAENFVTCW